MSLQKVMSIPALADEIISYLMPQSVLHLVIGARLEFPAADMKSYMAPTRVLFGPVAKRMLQEGCRFVFVARTLGLLQEPLSKNYMIDHDMLFPQEEKTVSVAVIKDGTLLTRAEMVDRGYLPLMSCWKKHEEVPVMEHSGRRPSICSCHTAFPIEKVHRPEYEAVTEHWRDHSGAAIHTYDWRENDEDYDADGYCLDESIIATLAEKDRDPQWIILLQNRYISLPFPRPQRTFVVMSIDATGYRKYETTLPDNCDKLLFSPFNSRLELRMDSPTAPFNIFLTVL